jgi:signal transduction histidine kinase
MKSIRRKLVVTLSVTITGVVLCILLATDIAVDSWVDNEFNRGMHAKARMLMTLIHKNERGLSFNFPSEFMPEFEGKREPEYYQIWQGERIFTRSDSLALFSQKNLPFEKISVNDSIIQDINLPDGRNGRVIYVRFTPKIQNDTTINTTKKESTTHLESITLAYAASSEEVDFILWLIDFIFIVTTITVVVFIRLFVRKAIDTSLAPLIQLNQDISELSIQDENAQITVQHPVKELSPIVDSLNAFIKENRQLYLREKRLTSDIAHEIKTPISELINMAEVAIRFPNEKEINDDFKPETLKISLRLKSIVSNLLLLHKYSDSKLSKSDACDLNQVIMRVLENSDLSRIVLNLNQEAPAIISNLFALESIICNLINNAKQYSPDDTNITVTTQETLDSISVSISNTLIEPINEVELIQFFDPLWQKDTARTSNENFGLGLSIAKTLCYAIDAQLTVNQSNGIITFNLIMPRSNKQ